MSEHRDSEELKYTEGMDGNMITGKAGASQINVWIVSHIAAAMQEAGAQKMRFSCLCWNLIQ